MWFGGPRVCPTTISLDRPTEPPHHVPGVRPSVATARAQAAHRWHSRRCATDSRAVRARLESDRHVRMRKKKMLCHCVDACCSWHQSSHSSQVRQQQKKHIVHLLLLPAPPSAPQYAVRRRCRSLCRTAAAGRRTSWRWARKRSARERERVSERERESYIEDDEWQMRSRTIMRSKTLFSTLLTLGKNIRWNTRHKIGGKCKII